MVSILQGWGVLCIFLTHTAVYVHAGYKYSFTVVEGHDVDLPIPKHCFDGHFLIDNENDVMAKFDRRLPQYYESRRGQLNNGCFSKISTRCDFRMKVTSLSESRTYRLYHTSLSEAPYPCDIVYSLEVWPGVQYVVTGKLEGFLNGIELADLNIVATCDKICNLSIDSLQRQAGLPVTMLLSTDLFELIGWMFAISDNKEVRNGYTLTDGFCKRIAKINYPNRRAVTLSQVFYRTKLNEFRLDTSINGTIPLKYLFTKNVKRNFNTRYTLSIPVQEYEEIYKQTSAGLIEMASVRLRPFGNETLNYTINQTIRFDRPWASTFDNIAHLKPAVLLVTNVRVSYHSADMQARLKMTSNISLLKEGVFKDTEGHKIDLTDDIHRTTDLMPMEIVIPVIVFLMILSLLMGYCCRKEMQKGVSGKKIGVIGTIKADHKSTVTDRESQVLIEEDAASCQNTYESITSDSTETIQRNEVNDKLDREYLSPVFHAVNSKNEENQESQTETGSHLQTNTVVGHTSNVYEEINSHFELKYQLLSITNLKEVVGNTSNSNEERECNSQITDHLLSNTNLKQVVGNDSNTYEETDSQTHRKQIAYNTDILEASTTIEPSSNIDAISETNLKPDYEPIYYYPGHLQYVGSQSIDVRVTDSHEYETVTPIMHGKLYHVVNGLSEDSYMIPCVKDSDKISTSKSEHKESTSEETLVKQISTSNTDLKTLYNTTYEEMESNRSVQLVGN